MPDCQPALTRFVLRRRIEILLLLRNLDIAGAIVQATPKPRPHPHTFFPFSNSTICGTTKTIITTVAMVTAMDRMMG